MKCITALGREFIRLNQVGGSIEMTTFKKFLGLGMMLAAIALAGAVPAFAQGCDDVDGIAALDAKIRKDYPNKATLPAAIASGKEFLQKFGTCPTTTDFSTWLKGQLPEWEKIVGEADLIKKRETLYAKYVSELGASKWDAAIATSKELLTVFPADKSLNIYIPLASLGLYESYKKNDKYVDVSIQNAKLVLEKYKANEESLKDTHGIAPYAYGSKENAVSEMKFILGYLLTTKKGDKKNGLTYLYEVAQSPGLKKTDPRLFTTVATYYIEQGEKVGSELKALQDKIIAADVEIKKEGTTPERITELNKLKIETNNQIVAKEPYYMAWAERAIDAYGRAINSTKGTTAADKQYRDALYEAAKAIYVKRFENPAGLDSYIATTVAKPMPNPTTDVTPVAAPAETTTSGTSAVIAKPEPATASAKPASVSQPAATKATAKASQPVATKATAKVRPAKPRK